MSEDVAARVWRSANPIGRRLRMGAPDSPEPWLTVVGVAARTRYRELATARPTLYLPAAQFVDTAERLAIRTSAPSSTVAPAIRGQIEAIDPGVRVLQVATFGTIIAGPLAQPRFNVTVSTAFALTATALAAIGLYAALAASVRQRHREIAIRIAIGATPSIIRWLVVAEALWLTGIGAAIGCAVAVITTRLGLESLAGASVDDPVALGWAVALLLAASALAAYWPIRAATRVDPIVSLRA